MKLLEALGIRAQEGPAAAVTLHEYASNRSVALLVGAGRPDAYVGSGVCIRIASRLLVATAAHNLVDLDPKDLIIFGRGERFGQPLKVLHIGSSVPKNKEDVSWLELDPSGSLPPRLKFVGLDQIGCFDDQEDSQSYFLQGYPAEAVEDASSQRPLLESDGLVSLSIPRSKRQSPHLDGIDIAVEYPPHDGSLAKAGLPKPHGISGGRLWVVPRFADHLVWSAEQAKLVGIQRAWWRAEQEAVATRIECWLKMVANEIPDLRDEIMSSTFAKPSTNG
jgi:hypothetical protein